MESGVDDGADWSFWFKAKVSRGVRRGVAPGGAPRIGVAETPFVWPCTDRSGVAIGFGVAVTCFVGFAPSKPVEPAPVCNGVFSPPKSEDCVLVNALMFLISFATRSSCGGALGVRIGVAPTIPE